MTSVEIIAIITAIGGVIVAPVLTYLTLRETKKVGAATEAVAVVVSEVKHEVNSKTAALVKEIAGLQLRVAELLDDRDNVVEVARLAAAAAPEAAAPKP